MKIKGIEKYTELPIYSASGEDFEKVFSDVSAAFFRAEEDYGKAVASNIFSRLIAKVETGELLNAEKLRDMAKEYGVFLEEKDDE